MSRLLFCPLRADPKVPGYGEFEILRDCTCVRGKRGRVGGVRFTGQGNGIGPALERLEQSAYCLSAKSPSSPGYPTKSNKEEMNHTFDYLDVEI